MSFFQISSKPAMREQAGAKLHLLHNATEQTIERIDTADEKTHDSTLFKTGPWREPPHAVRSRLLQVPPVCADRRERRLLREPAETEREPGDYGRITGMARPRHSLKGKQLRTVLDDLDRKYIDVEVEVEFKRGPYNGTQSLDTKRFRVVGVRDGTPTTTTCT